MVRGRREGGRSAFSYALEEFVLAGKISLPPPHQAPSPSLFAFPSLTIFPISQTLHCSIILWPPLIYSLIILLSCQYFPPPHSIFVSRNRSCVVQCQWQWQDKVNKHLHPWTYLTSHRGCGMADTHKHKLIQTNTLIKASLVREGAVLCICHVYVALWSHVGKWCYLHFWTLKEEEWTKSVRF